MEDVILVVRAEIDIISDTRALRMDLFACFLRPDADLAYFSP